MDKVMMQVDQHKVLQISRSPYLCKSHIRKFFYGKFWTADFLKHCRVWEMGKSFRNVLL
jgi:hypothetical protein